MLLDGVQRPVGAAFVDWTKATDENWTQRVGIIMNEISSPLEFYLPRLLNSVAVLLLSEPVDVYATRTSAVAVLELVPPVLFQLAVTVTTLSLLSNAAIQAVLQALDPGLWLKVFATVLVAKMIEHFSLYSAYLSRNCVHVGLVYAFFAAAVVTLVLMLAVPSVAVGDELA
ncbi:hypothetical protein T492DRAFT_858778 [Pavlovales sp. CCMP2436]|nr:hypothetical protein T492DRAFT_858778 [Pavlovales sp. CCMP2436]